MPKKKVIVNIVVALEVDEEFDVKKELAVVAYRDNIGGIENYLPKTDDFEVLDYISIKEV